MLNYFTRGPSGDSYLEREGRDVTARAPPRDHRGEGKKRKIWRMTAAAAALIQIKHYLLCRRSRSQWVGGREQGCSGVGPLRRRLGAVLSSTSTVEHIVASEGGAGELRGADADGI